MDSYLSEQIEDYIKEHGMKEFLEDIAWCIDEDLGKIKKDTTHE